MLNMMSASACFHLSTLEEYYTGGLFLGPGNGISDGSVIVYIVFIVMGALGNEFWLTTMVGSVRLIVLFAYLIASIQIVVILACLRNIFVHKNKELKPGDITGEPFVLSKFLLQLLGYFLP